MIKQLHAANTSGETQAPKKAESANKRKTQVTNSSEPGQSSDADDLLADTSKQQKTANNESDNTACSDGADEDDSLLDEIAQSLSKMEKTDPKVSDKLAKIINLRWLNKLDNSNLKDKCGKYLRPANCDRLITPKVNPEIWGQLDPHARGNDLKLSNLQATLTKVGNITAKTKYMLLKAHSENTPLVIEAMIRMNTDTIALLGHVSFEIAQRRCNVI